MQTSLKVLALLPIAGLTLAGCSGQMNATVDVSPTPTMTVTPVSSASPTSMNEEGTQQPSPSSQTGVMVGGAMMVSSNDIVTNAQLSSDHSTVVTAIKAAGLVETLQSKGPYTVFAPTNSAFEKLPAGTVSELIKPEKKADLTKVLTYHVVSGRYLAKDLKNGQKLKTVQGQELTINMTANGQMTVTDAMGGVATVSIKDVISSNGVTFVTDSVLMPKLQ